MEDEESHPASFVVASDRTPIGELDRAKEGRLKYEISKISRLGRINHRI